MAICSLSRTCRRTLAMPIPRGSGSKRSDRDTLWLMTCPKLANRARPTLLQLPLFARMASRFWGGADAEPVALPPRRGVAIHRALKNRELDWHAP